MHMNDTSIRIRDAVVADSDFVTSLIVATLEPFYGGDHRSHAERILTTHLSGGEDRIGFFSTEQHMFIAESADGRQAGIIHLVGKKQGTYKISPLIVAPAYRGTHGVGRRLIDHAEAYARARGARQLYCTVADTNAPALEFFLARGFIRAGASESQYKLGVKEWMLYKILDDQAHTVLFDRQHISVLPFSEELAQPVRELLLRRLGKDFGGIDDGWVDSLFAGYHRRASGDVNAKYKLIFVARDEAQQVRGVVGATPKKGEPIKLMPFVAEDPPAFNALVTDVPSLLKPHGRKVYSHMVPSVDEVVLMQRRGWTLDGLMPSAYHPNQVTQQWSFDVLNNVNMRHLRVKQEFLDAIQNGSKTVEVRVAYEHLVSIEKNERIRLMSMDQSATVDVSDVLRFQSFDALLDSVDPSKIVPGRNRVEVLSLLRTIYPKEKESLGVLALVLGGQAKSSGGGVDS